MKGKSPGPKYGAPTTVGYVLADPRIITAPAYSLGKRLDAGSHSGRRVPGPKYDVSNITRHGRVSEGANGAIIVSKIPERSNRIPGPATYNTGPCMPVTKPAMPMYSMGVKLASRKKSGSIPAPNAYSKASTLGNQAVDVSSAPMYTILGKRVEPQGGGGKRIPGPNKYPAVQLELFKSPAMPRPVILGPWSGCRGKRTPAPNAYFPGPSSSRYASAPQYSMAARIAEQSQPFYTAVDKVPDWGT
ncbi:Hypothetical protein CINCED_3A014373 [Cinara cedri]|uniref:Outer dense fiber protein 3 n=1 Tax=Cinara cedri TaxID=506608 RepID=A0A5E4N8J3_9HEMI|nr:Hypothetical protein CINCED_3A014373 [Cinara cedri]